MSPEEILSLIKSAAQACEGHLSMSLQSLEHLGLSTEQIEELEHAGLIIPDGEPTD